MCIRILIGCLITWPDNNIFVVSQMIIALLFIARQTRLPNHANIGYLFSGISDTCEVGRQPRGSKTKESDGWHVTNRVLETSGPYFILLVFESFIHIYIYIRKFKTINLVEILFFIFISPTVTILLDVYHGKYKVTCTRTFHSKTTFF